MMLSVPPENICRIHARMCAIVCSQWTNTAIDHKEHYHVTNCNTQA